jgi:hypothetical protein
MEDKAELVKKGKGRIVKEVWEMWMNMPVV